jgi:hypothetical protein
MTMGVSVLIVDDDTFRSRYVASGLARLDATIIGPVAAASEACSLIENGLIPEAVIMADHLADGPAEALLRKVRCLGIPHLVLIENGPREPGLAATPVLMRPFASFQVADWVTKTIERG